MIYFLYGGGQVSTDAIATATIIAVAGTSEIHTMFIIFFIVKKKAIPKGNGCKLFYKVFTLCHTLPIGLIGNRYNGHRNKHKVAVHNICFDGTNIGKTFYSCAIYLKNSLIL